MISVRMHSQCEFHTQMDIAFVGRNEDPLSVTWPGPEPRIYLLIPPDRAYDQQ